MSNEDLIRELTRQLELLLTRIAQLEQRMTGIEQNVRDGRS
jgi:hypothetical protein